ncbi:MAG: hypothetical protein ACPG4X_15765 [Pikeienuella sp.]
MRISLGIQLQNSGGSIITAVVSPSMGALTNTDTPADGYNPGAYASSEGTISSASPTYYVNGFEELGTYDLQDGDEVYARVLVTDSESNTRTFTTNRSTVPLGADALAFNGDEMQWNTDPIIFNAV